MMERITLQRDRDDRPRIAVAPCLLSNVTGARPMTGEITSVWKQVTPELQSELIAFWARNHAISDPTQVAARAQQAVCVGRDEKGELWGVGTAYLGVLPSLGQPTYFYRQFFAEASRGRRMTVPFFERVVETLQAYNATLPMPESIGVLLELQNHQLSVSYTSAYMPDGNSTFIGYSPRGNQLRVTYFEDAKLLLPPPPPRKSAPAA